MVYACVWDPCSSQSWSVCPGATMSPQGTSLLYGTSAACGASSPCRTSLEPCRTSAPCREFSPCGSLSSCAASHPKRHSHRMDQSPHGALSLCGASSPCGMLSLYTASAPCGASLHPAALSPCEAGIVAHRALSPCASPCARCQLSAPPTCSAYAGTRWLSVALPAWGQEPLFLPLLPAWGHGHLLVPQGPDHSPLPGDRILECLHGNKLICA